MEKKLKEIFKIILDEVESNGEFKNKIYKVLENEKSTVKKKSKKKVVIEPKLNPQEVILEGESNLVDKLTSLEIGDLKDIIKFYEMDNTNSSSRWKKKDRLINYIVDVTKSRVGRGNAFRD